MNRKQPGKTTEDRPSKTQLKREMHELQALGESLIKLPDSELSTLPLPEPLLAAVRDAKKMNRRGALHRQKQYIGKVMRSIDADPIREALAQKQINARAAVARFHVVEDWRDRLIRDGDSVLEKFVEEYPETDRQHIRRLIRSAIAERKRSAPPRAYRQLFRYIDQLMQ